MKPFVVLAIIMGLQRTALQDCEEISGILPDMFSQEPNQQSFEGADFEAKEEPMEDSDILQQSSRSNVESPSKIALGEMFGGDLNESSVVENQLPHSLKERMKLVEAAGLHQNSLFGVMKGKEKEDGSDLNESAEQWNEESLWKQESAHSYAYDPPSIAGSQPQAMRPPEGLGFSSFGDALVRLFDIFPVDRTKAGAEGKHMEFLDEQRYLAAHQNARGTRVWNFAYLDDASIYKDSPSWYYSDWFWVRWARKFMHYFLPKRDLLQAPQSIEAISRSATVLPLPILREAAKFITFVTPDGNVANHKNIVPKMDHDVCIFSPLKIVIHLYSNHTLESNGTKGNSFFYRHLNKEVPVSPVNPFQNVDWGNQHSKNAAPEKWMRLMLRAARELYVMLLLDSVIYSEYKHELYTFLWETMEENGTMEIPSLSSCGCSMFYVSPFEVSKENISLVLDDSIPISFSETDNLLPATTGPQRSAQLSILMKEYYTTTIQLVDIMARIHANINANYLRYGGDPRCTVIAQLHSSLGRIIPSVNETLLDKMRADGTDYHTRKEEFAREHGFAIDPMVMPPTQFQNAYPMIHYAFQDDMPFVNEMESEDRADTAIRSRDFGPLTFCGTNYFRRQTFQSPIYHDSENSSEYESYAYTEKFKSLSALKLSAPLGPANSSIQLDIICPCVSSSGNAPPLRDALHEEVQKFWTQNGNLDEEVHRVSGIGKSTWATEYAVFGNNCYAVLDPYTTSNTRARSGADSYWALSLKDQSMVLPEIEKQVKLDGWQWENAESTQGLSGREYGFIVEPSYIHSAQVIGSKDPSESNLIGQNEQWNKGAHRWHLNSPFSQENEPKAFVNSTSIQQNVLGMGQILPCINECSTRLYQSSEIRFLAESCMCKVGVFNEMLKSWKIGPEHGEKAMSTSTSFHPVRPIQPPTDKPVQQASVDRQRGRKNMGFQDPFETISLLHARTFQPLDLPDGLAFLLADQVNNFLYALSNSTQVGGTAREIGDKAELIRWFRRALDAKHHELPEFIKQILPHVEVMPDPHSPFKKNVICIPPSFNFHWNLQREENVADYDSVYAKSVAKFYRHMYEQDWTPKATERQFKSVQRHFIDEVRRNHFLFSHHKSERVDEFAQRNHTSVGNESDWILPILPKDPFAQSVLPFPQSISGKHDLSSEFHPFRFPRGTKKAALGVFLGGEDELRDVTLMESVSSPLVMLSFIKHISTVSLGMYFYDLLHPDLPCTSVVYTDSRSAGEYPEDARSAGFSTPSFLEKLPTKNDIFVTINGETPSSMRIPPLAQDSKSLAKAVSEKYTGLFTKHMDFLFSQWNDIFCDWQRKETGRDNAGKKFDAPLFLDFPSHSWKLSDDHSSATIMPLLQEISAPSKDMVLVNIYCPCEPLRDAAWTVMSTSCVRVYRSDSTTYLYAQNPETKEYFIIDTTDGEALESSEDESPVTEKYFGYMPQAFSSKNTFASGISNATLAENPFEHVLPFDGKAIPVPTDQVSLNSPCPCASACQPLMLNQNMLPHDEHSQRSFYRRLYTSNFCRAGVTVKN
ncbi:long-chain-fatty-acid-CoA ligase [Perkinsela sp. CCAP 1560/4]|nr:long-chain-fatty-acid-CoA ligase [Perkinsela sp. CCAP 1560/4]|eukprot:KNH07139.1 long-chain-fatty-acid-CoA ligase [Perkinsela sp. CCAP 1560/4]